jgi:nuclear transcription Y subunit beta
MSSVAQLPSFVEPKINMSSDYPRISKPSSHDHDDGKCFSLCSRINSFFYLRILGGRDKDDNEVREQDRFLPVANIARIMKTVLPPNAKIAKDAKEAIQECVSEFISFITSEASDKCLQEKRKTINGDDLLWAMSTLGFDRYIDPLKVYLGKYRDAVKGEKPDKKTGKGGKDGMLSNFVYFCSLLIFLLVDSFVVFISSLLFISLLLSPLLVFPCFCLFSFRFG